MIHFYKFTKNIRLLATLIFILSSLISFAQNKPISNNTNSDTNQTQKSKNNSQKTVNKKDSFKISTNAFDAPIYYKAEDSLVMNVSEKKLYLYGKESSTKYQDYDLKAPGIQVNQSTQIVKAHLTRDSTGKVIAFPVFQQGDFKTVSDSLTFNLKTGKGITKKTYTTQEDMYIQADVIKKDTGRILYASNAKLTTCNLDTPHFALVSKKLKLINGIAGFSGPLHPEVEGIPLPITLPFALYPLRSGRRSGFIAPSFTSNDQLGLTLQGIGYYKILNEFWDLQVQGTIYSLGSWNANIIPRYYKKYRYSGSFNLGIISQKTNFKQDIDYSKRNSYKINWAHSMDSKARPGVTFSANVDAGTNSYNKALLNNVQTNFNNILTSTINYTKIWQGTPFSFSALAGHNQNTNENIINITMPEFSFTMNAIYPFKRKEAIGAPKWYENFSIGYNNIFKTVTNFEDNKSGALKQLLKNYRWGSSQSIPLTVALPALGPLIISPNISFNHNWFQNKSEVTWNPVTVKLDTLIKKGFYTASNISYGFGINTRIYGMVQFKPKSRVLAIRHEIRPNIGMSFVPTINARSNKNIQTDAFGNFSKYNTFNIDNIYQGFGNQKTANIDFGLDNVIQMKWRNKKDTGDAAIKKINILDGLSINSAYNLLADSFAMRDISMQARTNLFEKISITAGANLSPYQLNEKGKLVDKYIWKKNPFSLGRLTSINASMSTQFKGGNGKTKKPTERLDEAAEKFQMTADEMNAEAAYIQNNPSEFIDFSIPWSINLSYSFQLTKAFNDKLSRVKSIISQSANVSGDINITPKWKAGTQFYYDIQNNKLSGLSFFLSREMHCWQMSINVQPVGPTTFFSFNLSPKSGLLRDLKINRTRYFINN